LSLIADYLDGYLARRAGEVTGFGQALDIEFDGLGLAASTALAVHYGQLPLVYFLTVGLARYLYLLAGWVVRRSGRAVHPLPDSLFRRSIAGVTMELSAAALWPIVPAAMMTVGGAIVAVPFLAGFLRDGLIHLGWIDPASPDYLAVRRETARIAGELLPPVLRLAMALLLGPLLVSAALSFPTTVEAFRRAGSAAPQLSAAVVIGLCSIALLMVVIGAAGRAAAVVILVVYGLTLALVAPSTRGLAAWGCAMGIYILGTGAGSPWQPDRPLFDRRAGERP
jgi:phosphatidylglycerophosphate synthase